MLDFENKILFSAPFINIRPGTLAVNKSPFKDSVQVE